MVERIETLEDIRVWIADHDARINELWRAQHERNRKVEMRLSFMEKRVVWFSGAMAAVGSMVGAAFAVLSKF